MCASKVTSSMNMKKTPLKRLYSDPKILPSIRESRDLEIQDDEIENNQITISSMSNHTACMTELDPPGIINHHTGKLLTPDPLAGNSKNSASNISPLKTNSNHTKLLVKQKSLGRTLSTSVLRIKKKRSFWSQHVKQ